MTQLGHEDVGAPGDTARVGGVMFGSQLPGDTPTPGEVYLGDPSPGDVKASHRLRMRRDASPYPTGTEGHPDHCDEGGHRDAHEGMDDMDDGGGTVHEASASFPKA